MPALEIALLGPFQVRLAGELISQFATVKVQALLAYLAVEGDHPHRRETLAGLFWPEQSETAARVSLRQTLFQLRQAIPAAYVPTTRQTVQFDSNNDYSLDVTTFTTLINTCHHHSHPTLVTCQSCLARLQEATTLYRGDFLADFFLADSAAFEEWALLKREWLRREALQALYHLSAHHQQQGDYETAYQYAWQQVELDPLREEAYQQLMLILASSGRRSEALAQYDTCRQVLAEALAAEPAVKTTALYERIRIGEERQAESITPAIPHNLPAQATPFVGRERELTELTHLLADPEVRLISILGPGGSGKTRLALAAGAAQLDNFRHGVFLVSLAPLDSVEAIVPTVAEALGFSFYKGAEPQQQLLDYLRQKTMLLIMDSYEHLLPPAIPVAPGRDERGNGLVTEILKTAPEVKILATSRVRLNVGGEHRFQVGGMDYPTDTELADVSLRRVQNVAQYDAVRLFLQEARRARPGFALTDENLNGIVQVCQLLEGIPLGIRLAAAWLEILIPAEIAEEIDRGLDFLETEVRDLPERQRSMRAAFDYSWQLLTEREKVIYQALSIFRGGFTRQAAAEVAGASVQALKALADKSFLTCVVEGRYEIHELLRQYAAEKLEQVPAIAAAVRARHSAYYCAFLQQREGDLKGPRWQAAMAEIEAELKNAQVAWNRAVAQGQIERLAGAIESLGMFYDWRGRCQEGEAAFRLAAEGLAPSESGAEYRILAMVLAWQGYFNLILGRAEFAGKLLSKSLTLLDNPELAEQDTGLVKAFIFELMGYMAFGSDREKAKQLYEKSLNLYRSLDDRFRLAVVLQALGWLARQSGAYAEAEQLAEESLAIYRALGHQKHMTDSLDSLGFGALQQGRLEEGEQLIRESVAIGQETEDSITIARGHRNLGVVLTLRGRFAEGCALLEESITIYNDLGMHGFSILGYTWLGLAKMHLGQYEQAEAQAERGRTLAQEWGHRGVMANALLALGSVALAEEAYSAAREMLQESATIYQELGQHHELAVAQAILGYAARGQGNVCQARQCLFQALQAVATHSFYPLVMALTAVALLLADRGEQERGVELYALASRYPYVANSCWFEDVAGRHMAAFATTLPPEVVATAQERGRSRDLWETVKELLVELEKESTSFQRSTLE